MTHEQDPLLPFGPITNPVDRFSHLPEHTRAWLESLRAEDIGTLQGILVSYRRATIAGWLVKWIFVTAFTVAGSFALFAEQINTIRNFLAGH